LKSSDPGFNQSYRGRFAPSPTGPLHFGSLVTALASYLDARSHGGTWLVRIEDLDPLRESPEATEQILASLTAHGLESDEPFRFQSDCHQRYQLLIDRLIQQGKAYRCICSRKELQAANGYHPHHCRDAPVAPGDQPFAVRFALEDEDSVWPDLLLGEQHQRVRAGIDDPVIRRKEGFYAYQLAVVADDIDQQITRVVRGSDLLEMTAQQCQIYRALGGAVPAWLHIPVILNEQGQKLSKQNLAPPLDDKKPAANLLAALEALGQDVTGLGAKNPVAAILQTATGRWQRARIHLTSR
jgi:glutamyl-Q tRNA(Asp) synthetase